ncbi:pentalenene synthase [Micromonospora sp. NPDC048830]|uniref:terpene synthase family protein n=1 Tax=Micromonospora sp. NPDC048830 TaxID=3364257 RepID=UPI00371F666B
MPQGVATYIPFATRISPWVGPAATRHLAWPRSYGLLPDEAAELRHLQGRYPELAGRFHPAATGADLDLAVDQMSWFFLFDDQFDGTWGRNPQRAAQLIDAVLGELRDPREPGAVHPMPLVRAFADLWKRSREGMSAAWCARAAANWRAYLSGHATEAEHRARASGPTRAEHLTVRSHTAGVQPILDLAERIGHYEVPTRVYDSDAMAAMRLIAAEVVVLDNEIVSVEKEEAVGDHNLVLLEQQDGRTRGEAIDTVCAMIRTRIERFLRLEAALPELAEHLALGPVERHAVDRFRTDALHTVMRGAHDWQQHSLRYAVEPADPARDVAASPRAN